MAKTWLTAQVLQSRFKGGDNITIIEKDGGGFQITKVLAGYNVQRNLRPQHIPEKPCSEFLKQLTAHIHSMFLQD